MKAIALPLILACFVGAQERPVIDAPFVALHAGLFASTAIDAHSTMRCLNAGSCQEANPLFGKRPSTARVYGQAFAITAGVAYLDFHLKKRSTKLWVVGLIVGIAVHTLAARHNYGIQSRVNVGSTPRSERGF